MNENKKNKMEDEIIALIEDEDYNGAGDSSDSSGTISKAVTSITKLIGITSACTRDCWHPGK